MRFGDTGSQFKIQNTTAGNLWTIANESGNVLNTGNLTVSGVLQSPLTSLISVSSTSIESNKADKLLFGTSISNINNTGSINYGVSISKTDAKVG